jgi:hypothetical protein
MASVPSAATVPRNAYADERARDAMADALDRPSLLAMHCLVGDETAARTRLRLMQQLQSLPATAPALPPAPAPPQQQGGPSVLVRRG